MRLVPVNTFSDSIFDACAEHLNRGKLVAFPTETVFGLGADGLNERAVKTIFEMKKRPPNDPVILHVHSIDEANKLWQHSAAENEVACALAKAFWPGPLSIVSKRSLDVPNAVTAGSEWVAVRIPSHAIALSLLRAFKRPIAAPSANPFGRISPTSASEVAAYFPTEDIMILDYPAVCKVGVESTVVRICCDADYIAVEILRKGFVRPSDIRKALDGAGLSQCYVKIDESLHKATRVLKGQGDTCDENCRYLSPGMLLRHYAPLTRTRLALETQMIPPRKPLDFDWARKLILNYRPSLKAEIQELGVGYYIEPVSSVASTSVEVLMPLTFQSLMRAEQLAECLKLDEILIFWDIELLHGSDQEHYSTILDRLFRAASGDCLRFSRDDSGKIIAL